MNSDWDFEPPKKEYFDELFRVSRNQIIWGGNYFDLPPTRCIVCWDKEQPWENFSQFELAWTSFDYPAAIFRERSACGKPKIHPTQKPVSLYAFLMKKYAKPGDRIFDSHLGSGSSRIAAFKLGYDFYATEIDEKFFRSQEKRFRSECFGETVLANGQKTVQKNLFE
jgi:site-specific DNA-methyltransferase (adenine-specific)